VRQLVREHDILVHNTQEYQKAQEKVMEALTHWPQSGNLHGLMCDCARRMEQDPQTMAKHMRRSVANNSHASDAERIFRARIGYSGYFGSIGQLDLEQQQLAKLLQDPNPPVQCCSLIPTAMLLLADSLLAARKYDEVRVFLHSAAIFKRFCSNCKVIQQR
jgi:hypothetical protein